MKMKNMAFLALMMVMIASPAMAFSGGSGTQGDPYIISTVQDWNEVQTLIDPGDYNDTFDGPARNFYFELANDLDVGSNSLDTSSGDIFGMSLEGNGYTLTSSSPLFGLQMSPAAPSSGNNLFNFTDMRIHSNIVDGSPSIGAFAGFAFGNGLVINIEQVKFTGSIEGTGGSQVGGIIGQITSGSLNIKDVHSNATVTSAFDAGGFFSNARVTTITNSLYYGVVSDANTPGGIADDGCCGTTASDAWYDSDVNPGITTFVGSGSGTVNLKDVNSPELFAFDITSGFDPAYVWGIDPAVNDGYPFLQSLEFEPIPPTIGVLSVVSFDNESVELSADVTEQGTSLLTERGFVYSTSPSPDLNDNVFTDATTTLGSMQETLTGLSDNTQYYFRAYASNSEGTSYSNEVSTTTIQNYVPATLGNISVVSINDSDVNNLSITLEGSVVSNGTGDYLNHAFIRGTNENYTEGFEQITLSAGEGTFQVTFSNLSANQEYYFGHRYSTLNTLESSVETSKADADVFFYEYTEPSSSSGGGTRYVADADGNVVGVQTNAGVQTISQQDEQEGTFLSLTGGESFNIKAWWSDLVSTVRGWFVQ